MFTKKARIISAGAAVAALAFSGSAIAGTTGHQISGTAPESGSWFISSNVRTMGGSVISASFNTAPTKGMAFRAINVNSGAQLGSIIYTPPLQRTQTMYSGGRAGTLFENAFKLQSPGHQSNYSFDGSENY